MLFRSLLLGKICIMFTLARNQFQLLLTNPVFLAGVCSWFSAQFIKTVIKLLSHKVRSFREVLELLFWRTGGMPSSHTALVCSLCTSIGIRSGINSDIFVLSGCFMLVVVRDALGVRRSSGIQAKLLNEIGSALTRHELIKVKPIKEVQGHKPIEVIIGCQIGRAHV